MYTHIVKLGDDVIDRNGVVNFLKIKKGQVNMVTIYSFSLAYLIYVNKETITFFIISKSILLQSNNIIMDAYVKILSVTIFESIFISYIN